MNEFIPFNGWSQAQIKAGRKCCTSRHKRYTKDPRVVAITPLMPWGYIRENLWRCEGAGSPMELQRVIEEIYGRHVPDDEKFFVHFLDFNPAAERGGKL